MTANPFLDPSPLPHGLPPFAEIRFEHFEPAFVEGMSQQRAEVAAIVADEEAPTFANTLEPLERSGRVLDRVAAVFFSLLSSDSTDALAELEQSIAPRLAEHADAIRLDPSLYARIATIAADGQSLTAEERYLAERYETEMRLAGAGLDEAAKVRLREINQRLSVLSARFDKNLLDDTNDLALVVDDPAELAGLDASEISGAAEAAAGRGLEGKHLITLVLPSGHPALASLRDRGLRERIMRASLARGSRDNAFDNRPVLLEIVRLRAERAELLGFASHAAAVAADNTAGTAEAVAGMLNSLAPIAARNARREADALAVRLRADGVDGPLESWDHAFYAEQERRELHSVDTAAMRPYFNAERVLRDGVFFAANALYGLTFTERPDLVGYAPGVRVFEVGDDDGPRGLYLLDLYTRDSKRGGAWMNSLVEQSELLGTRTIVMNNLNVSRPAEGEPTLLTLDEVETFFHEFGHALHGLLATVRFPHFAGTRVFRDFVEFPSQVNEMWALWPEVATSYARRFDTGEPMPSEVVDRVKAAQSHGEGFATTEYLAAALLDQAWHSLSREQADAVTDVEAFERQALADAGLDVPGVPPRYSSAYFAHIFAGGYDAGYYSYIWSEVLDADTVEWFRDNGGLSRPNGDRFRRYVLGIGGSRDPLAAYREFRGRDAEIGPLLARRGLDE
ncbi:M3 family metallopeptidase [Amnibacterium flavum]|uniref:Peptidase M3 n=1 Tax=Amnibacterium flavum TaxID=2173173 RepID=A0A2V1HQU6_9MICO|nr:M3 family metallopeptidase [Amnibacterium flavum]PVZ94012.1 peptidase M3 [Amnibacterium flavum]